jgi:hypothetical protein
MLPISARAMPARPHYIRFDNAPVYLGRSASRSTALFMITASRTPFALVNIRQGSLVRQLSAPVDAGVPVVAVDATGAFFYLVGKSTTAAIDAGSGQVVRTMPVGGGSAVLDPPTNHLLIAGHDTLAVVDARRATVLTLARSVPIDTASGYGGYAVEDLADGHVFLPDGSSSATMVAAGTGEILRPNIADFPWGGADYDPISRRIVGLATVRDSDQHVHTELREVDGSSGETILHREVPTNFTEANYLALVPHSGSVIVTGATNEGDEAFTYYVRTGRLIAHHDLAGSPDGAFSDDLQGSACITLSQQGKLRMLDARSGEVTRSFVGQFLTSDPRDGSLIYIPAGDTSDPAQTPGGVASAILRVNPWSGRTLQSLPGTPELFQPDDYETGFAFFDASRNQLVLTLVSLNGTSTGIVIVLDTTR